MDNDNTIPSQLGPANTIPSTLGPMSGFSERQSAAPSDSGGGLVKLFLLAALVALAVYLAR